SFLSCYVFFFQAEDGIRDFHVTGVQTCALPICAGDTRCIGGRRRARQPRSGRRTRNRLGRLRPPLAARGRRRGTGARRPRTWWRSEERRVGKECRAGWSPSQEKTTMHSDNGTRV